MSSAFLRKSRKARLVEGSELGLLSGDEGVKQEELSSSRGLWTMTRAWLDCTLNVMRYFWKLLIQRVL